MRPFLLLPVVCCFWLTSAVSMAAPSRAGQPTIRIVSPADNAVITGSQITVRVAVSHFKLVPPVLVGPNHWHQIPLLRGNQGHIHYLLDGAANLVLSRDVVVRRSHTWTDVAPGRHTITAYLANSQHAAFPGAAPAVIHVTVKPAQQRRATAAITPAIAITKYKLEKTSAGAELLIRVRVSHFTLLPPVYKNPPLLPTTEGHIHYALDSISNFIATTGATTALSHPWTNVSPGRHTVIAYLATSQHQLVPGTHPATVRIDVPRGSGPHGQTALFVGQLPTTGGAAQAPSSDGQHRGPGGGVALVGLGTLLVVLALGLARRRAAPQ